MYGGKNDDELVRDIVAGNTEDFRILVSRYKKLVSHVVFRLVSHPADADDLGQEIFMKIYQALPRYEFRSSLATWIAKIAYNHCLNYPRKKKTEQPEASVDGDYRAAIIANQVTNNLESISATSDAPDETLIKNETGRFLQQAINALPIQYRKLITFFYLDNLSYAEITEIMDLPLGTVKGYLFRARRQLKDELLARYDLEDLCL